MPRRSIGAGIRPRFNEQGQIVSYQAAKYHAGKRPSETFPVQTVGQEDPVAYKAALDWMAEREREIRAGTFGLPKPVEKKPITYDEARDAFLAMMRPTWSEDTYEGFYRRTYRTVWDKIFSGRRLDSITTSEIREELLVRYGEGRKHRSLQVYRQVLSALFNWAMEPGREHVLANPARAAKLPRAKEEPPKLTYRLHELQAFLRAVPASHRLLFRCLAFTGLRRSELYRWRWDWIDWNRGELHVKKGKTGYHVLPLPTALLEELRQELSRRSLAAEGKDLSQAFLFSDDGKRVDHRKTMVTAAEAAGTPTKGLGYHTFRYTLSSIIERMPGASWSVVQLTMRHARKSAGVTGLYVSSDRDIVRGFLNNLVTDVDGEIIARPLASTGGHR